MFYLDICNYKTFKWENAKTLRLENAPRDPEQPASLY